MKKYVILFLVLFCAFINIVNAEEFDYQGSIEVVQAADDASFSLNEKTGEITFNAGNYTFADNIKITCTYEAKQGEMPSETLKNFKVNGIYHYNSFNVQMVYLFPLGDLHLKESYQPRFTWVYGIDIENNRSTIAKYDSKNVSTRQTTIHSNYYAGSVLALDPPYYIGGENGAVHYYLSKYANVHYTQTINLTEEIKLLLAKAFCGTKMYGFNSGNEEIPAKELFSDENPDYYLIVCGDDPYTGDTCPEVKSKVKAYAKDPRYANTGVEPIEFTLRNFGTFVDTSDEGFKEEIVSQFEPKFSEYMNTCNIYSYEDLEDFDAEACRGKFDELSAVLEAWESNGNDQDEIIGEHKKTYRNTMNLCLNNNSNDSSKCTKEIYDLYLATLELTEVAPEDGKAYYCAQAEYFGSSTCSESGKYTKDECNAYKAVFDQTCDFYTTIVQHSQNDFLNGLDSFFDVSFDVGKCDTYLGLTTNKNHPAYYLQFLFDLIKYIAILILIGMSVADFLKAVFSQVQDNIKKAANKFLIRFLLVLVIFFLPDLIIFILRLLGVVDASTCGIR